MSDLYDSDRALARRMLAGDEMAFEEFFETYFRGLYRFAFARLDGNADAAEDVVQATLCKAVTKLATYRGEAALFTWLCTFCRHELSAHYARHQRSLQETPLVEDTPEIRAALESIGAAAARRGCASGPIICAVRRGADRCRVLPLSLCAVQVV